MSVKVKVNVSQRTEKLVNSMIKINRMKRVLEEQEKKIKDELISTMEANDIKAYQTKAGKVSFVPASSYKTLDTTKVKKNTNLYKALEEKGYVATRNRRETIKVTLKEK